MAHDPSLFLRRACIQWMKGDAGIAAIVGANVYTSNPPAGPSWPFVRMGYPIGGPFLATGLDGASVDFAVSAFAKGPDDTQVMTLASAIVASLGDAILKINPPFPDQAFIRWLGSQLLRDGAEATAWHAVVQFEAKIVH